MVVNLPAVSKNPRLLAFFKGFLVTLDGLENYLFWAELQEVRARFEADPDSDSLRANSWILYQVFVCFGWSPSSFFVFVFFYFFLFFFLFFFFFFFSFFNFFFFIFFFIFFC